MMLRSLLTKLLLDPYEREPDENRWLPHHYLIGVGLSVLGWYLWHPGGSPGIGSLLALAGLLIALDDVIDHTYGGHIRRWTEQHVGIRMGTPLDYAYRRLMRWGPARRAYTGLLEWLGY